MLQSLQADEGFERYSTNTNSMCEYVISRGGATEMSSFRPD